MSTATIKMSVRQERARALIQYIEDRGVSDPPKAEEVCYDLDWDLETFNLAKATARHIPVDEDGNRGESILSEMGYTLVHDKEYRYYIEPPVEVEITYLRRWGGDTDTRLVREWQIARRMVHLTSGRTWEGRKWRDIEMGYRHMVEMVFAHNARKDSFATEAVQRGVV